MMLRSFAFALVALAFAALTGTAEAATCNWVGGTGTWSTTNGVNWSSSSGGAGGTCAATGGVPKQAGDVATFDALSGGGTVTVDSTMNGTTINTITMGAFTGTLDFSVNNPSMTLGGVGITSFNITGTGTRTLKLGSGTFTCKSQSNLCFSAATITGLTFNGGSATINMTDGGSGNSSAIQLANNTIGFSGVTISASFTVKGLAAQLIASDSFANLTMSGGSVLRTNSGGTYTFSGTVTVTGTLNNPNTIMSDNIGSGLQTTAITVGAGSTFSYAVLANIVFTGAPVANNSFALGATSGVTVNAPSGGGGRIIGG